MNTFYKSVSIFCLILLFFVLVSPEPAYAYIGPGAGFALVSSLMTLLISFFLAFIAFLTLPVRILFRLIHQKKGSNQALADRIIIMGFDGMDPELCERYMNEGKLPNFSKLRQNGSYRRLGTTCPALSPVAWSTFSTGVHPARHNIYDFLMRNPNTYLPELSSSRIRSTNRFLKIGHWQFPMGKPSIQFLRKSRSFWRILGEHGIFSHILRVPITFPPEKFNGAMLSAMCVPDLKGTQGTFSYYTSDLEIQPDYTGGVCLQLQKNGNAYTGELLGPDHPFRKEPEALVLPFQLWNLNSNGEVKLQIQKKTYPLRLKTFTPWIRIAFRTGLGVKVHGICQFYLKSKSPNVELYVSPIQIDPEKPALPVSYPNFYSVYLAKLLGTFGTLGLIEDTWALNEHVLDEEDFLKQAYQIHEERENQFFHIFNHMKKGFLACVFDATDRIQHMFFRYLVEDHPANRGADQEKYKDSIEECYQKMDDLLGRVIARIPDDTVLLVLSDHGFKPFIRGININTWLHQNGYLTLKNDDRTIDYFRNVDWEKTKAYALGLAGIYLNIQGREKHGIVKSGEEAIKLKREIIQKLNGLKDPCSGKTAINRIIDSQEVYKGPYKNNAPDMIVGYNSGYRISWDGAIGKVTNEVFEDNTRNWSGDHGMDPEIVRGVLFCNKKVKNEDPSIADFAPTILKLFGVEAPSYMDGRDLGIGL